jgi:hypothetical protein
MSYIGSKPADAVLETDDIADGVVTNPKLSTGSQQNFRNIIINGDMSIAQRGTSASSITSSGYHALDRHRLAISSLGTWTISQSTDVPSAQGFAKSMKFDCTTADASPSAGDVMWVQHRIEGQNLQYIKKGTANAESLTLSFWVKSNKTGTYIAELEDTDNSRHIAKSYTIDSANTWEKKTITYAGDTTGTLTNDNNTSLELHLYLGAGTNYTSGTLATSWSSNTDANRAVGQVNLADNTANEWYITGVQLEAGTTASDFEFLPYDVNLRRCLRYYYLYVNGNAQMVGSGAYVSNTRFDVNVFFQVEMRANPTLVQNTGTNYYYTDVNGLDYFNDFTGITSTTKNRTYLYATSNVSGTAGQGSTVTSSNANSLIAFDSEL